MKDTIEEKAVAIRVLIEAAKIHPESAATLWQAARLLLNSTGSGHLDALAAPAHLQPAKAGEAEIPAIPTLKAEFDYVDENGLHSHRTVYVMGLTDGRDIKRNTHVPVADRYGYLLTGYCTLRKQIRSFRSSRISNLRTFIEGEPLEPNRQWWPQPARTPLLAG
ncbi:MAG TPA: hypothetical protein VH186_14230 [Chloroflexia bacterium]|nr:hypothetical protein [Chloroflexia bacterium]